jgi:type I restriction enzyme S subunit
MANEWPTAKIGDVCLRVTKGTTPTTGGGAFSKIGIAFIKVESITESGSFIPEKFAFIDAETDERLARSRLNENDILFTIAGTIGRVAQVTSAVLPANTNQAVAIVRPNRDVIYPRFLYYTLRDSKRIQLAQSKVVQSVQANFSLGELSAIELPLPSQTEQRAIAHILGTLDDKIELNRKQNETLEALASAIFKAWFVDFEPVRAKMDGRWQPGQSLPGLPSHIYDIFPDRLVESAMGEIPEGWEVSTLGEVCSYLTRGISPKYIDLGGVSVLNQKCIRDFFIDFSKSRRHDVEQKKIDGRALELGDVLVNSTGVGTLGRVAQVRRLAETTIVDSHVTVVRAGHRINPMYLGGFMRMRQPEIEAMGEGSTGQTELSRTKLGELKILLPADEVLDHFSKHTKIFSESIAANQEDSETLAQLRDTLLPKLISGDLRIQDAEESFKRANS